MIWVDRNPWAYDLARHPEATRDIDAGTIVVPARPAISSHRAALIEVLIGLGKKCTRYGLPSDADQAHLYASAWLEAESIHTMVLLSAQRWGPKEIEAVRVAANQARCTLTVVTTAAPKPGLCAYLANNSSGEHQLEPRIIPSGRIPPLEDPFRLLRSCRAPHVSLSALALQAGAEPADLRSIPTDDPMNGTDRLLVAGQALDLPPGTGRFVRAQQIVATAEGANQLFSIGANPMSSADIHFAALLACRETGFIPAPAPVPV
jgi:hypothetical protein